MNDLNDFSEKEGRTRKQNVEYEIFNRHSIY
jgi:hypothetical protein